MSRNIYDKKGRIVKKINEDGTYYTYKYTPSGTVKEGPYDPHNKGVTGGCFTWFIMLLVSWCGLSFLLSRLPFKPNQGIVSIVLVLVAYILYKICWRSEDSQNPFYIICALAVVHGLLIAVSNIFSVG